MPITLQGIDFLLTYGCTARCPHCSYRAGQYRSGAHLAPGDVEVWLCALRDHPLEWVMLFGGEPFIYPEDLLQMVSAVRRHTAAEPRVFTNGYWAYDENVAQAKLARLKAAGLDHIRFSVDAFHSAFVPVGRVALGIRAAQALGYTTIAVDNQWILSPDLDIPTNAVTHRMMAALAGMVDLTGVEVAASRTHPVGRGAEHLPEILRKADKMPAGLCRAEGLCVAPYTLGENLRAPYAVEIHPDGTVNLCAGVALGNAHEKPLADILSGYDYTKYPVIKTIAEGGPAALLEIAEARGYARLPGYVDPCHLCYEVRAFLHTNGPEALRDGLAPAHIYDRAR